MWFRRRQDSDFQAEIEAHIRLETDRLIADGMPAEQAQATARRAFGNAVIARERFYQSQRWMWWDELRRDVRYGLRSLTKTPSFVVAAALTIALSVGANTAVFSLVDAVLLQSLPVSDPSTLVFVETIGNAATSTTPPYRAFVRLREQTSAFSRVAAYATDELRIEIDGNPEQVNGQIASGDYFPLLGTEAALGRLPDTNDENLDTPIAVISDRYWRRRFGGDPAVLGRTFSAGGRTFTIAGVTPPGFDGTAARICRRHHPPNRPEGRLPGGHGIVARLKPGVPERQAQAQSTIVLRAVLFRIGLPRASD